MHKFLSTISACLIIGSCSGASDNHSENNSQFSEANPEDITGIWIHTVDNAHCTEEYTLFHDDSFTFISLDRRLSGVFEQREGGNGDRDIVVFKNLEDNQQPDCYGSNERYVSPHGHFYKRSGQILEFYSNQEQVTPLSTWFKHIDVNDHKTRGSTAFLLEGY